MRTANMRKNTPSGRRPTYSDKQIHTTVFRNCPSCGIWNYANCLYNSRNGDCEIRPTKCRMITMCHLPQGVSIRSSAKADIADGTTLWSDQVPVRGRSYGGTSDMRASVRATLSGDCSPNSKEAAVIVPVALAIGLTAVTCCFGGSDDSSDEAISTRSSRTRDATAARTTASSQDSSSAAGYGESISDTGQNYRGLLEESFNSCVDGSAQSPIDVRDPLVSDLQDTSFHYNPAMLVVSNKGHKIQASTA